MRFAFVTFGEGTSATAWWMRLQAEGNDVRVFPDGKPQFKAIGKGLVHLVDSYQELLRWGAQDDRTVYVFEATGNGKDADALRKQGKLVFGGGTLNDRLEEDRRWAEELAKVLGIRLPKTFEYTSIDEALKIANRLPPDEGWYFKSDKYLEGGATYGAHDTDDLIHYLEHVKRSFGNNIAGIIQQKIDGVVIDTELWWDGERFVEPAIGMLEYKKSWTGDLGPNAGCAINLVWAYSKTPRLFKDLHWGDVAQLWKRLKLCPGPYSINSVINKADKRPYFLEWGPRMGYDEGVTYLQGLKRDLGDVLYECASGALPDMPFSTDEYWLGIRLSVPPYPWEHLNVPNLTVEGLRRKDVHSAFGTPVRGVPDLYAVRFAPYGLQIDLDGNLTVADPGGLLGVALSRGSSLSQLWEDALSVARKIRAPQLQYRIDGLERARNDLRLLRGWGYGDGMPS